MTASEAVEYEVLILQRMIEQLPDTVRQLLLVQFEKVINSLIARDKALKSHIRAHVEDAILAVKLQEFDLIATKQEKQALQKRLNDLR